MLPKLVNWQLVSISRKINLEYERLTVMSHIYAYDRAKTLSFILLIRRKSTEFENESNV